MRLNTPSFVAIFGLCVLILGLLCAGVIFPKLENYLIAKETALEEGSKAFKSWTKIPFPFKFKIYFFNVTNPDEVQAGGEPVFKEIGPYIYDEFREREIVSVDEENDTIKYVQRKIYHFNQEQSGCRSDDDVVTIINVGVVSTVRKVNEMAPSALSMVNDGLPFLYPGIKNVFVTNSINGSDDGPYVIERGLKGTTKGKVISFKNKTKLSEWGGDYCNTIRGTDLTVNPNMLDIPKEISFFASDFCRSFSATFSKEIDYSGLHTYKFVTNDIFESDENCFCDESGEVLPTCPPAGTMNIGPCTESQIVISQPHFLNAEKSLLKYARGLKPNKKKHGTFIIMEPKTGLALVVKTRFQMNIFLQRFDAIDLLRNVSEGLFPFMWLEEGAEVPLHIIEEIRNNFSKLNIFNILKYIMIISGVALLGVSLILAMLKDNIFWFCGNQNVGKNTVSVGETAYIRKYAEMYPNLKITNVT